ncbi:MAG: pilus assembly PilX N-terminal domain-containing protein [Lachnospiraceae bacterium]
MTSLINKRKINNQGIALVSVMIIATVCMLVATIVIEMTYNALLSRRVYNSANDNMYSAETAVDEMESVLQSVAVYSVKRNNLNPSESFIDIAEDTLLKSAGASSLLEYDKIADYFYSQLSDYYKKCFGSKKEGSDEYTRDSEKFSITAIKNSQNGTDSSSATLAITVNFLFEDEKGFASRISADLVLNDVTKRRSASDYSMGSYSMFTGGGAEFRGNDRSDRRLPVFVQEGNVYMGTMSDEAPTALKVTDSVLYIEGAAIINGDVHLNGKTVLNFTAGEDDGNNRTEVTIRGTVYIDKEAALVISDEIDFMCRDIVVVDGNNQYSLFDVNSAPYYAYDGTSTYKKYFPYDTTTFKGITNGANNKVHEKYHQTFDNNKVGGCVLISSGDDAYVAKWNGSGWRLLKGGTEVPTRALINHSVSCMPEAKTTVWTYDNKQVQVDAELAKFVNVQLLYFQRYMAPNTSMHAHYAQMLKHDSNSTIVRVTLPISFGGAPLANLSSVNMGDNTTELLRGGYLDGGPRQDQNGLTFRSMGLSDIILGDNVLKGVMFKIGNIQDCGENIPDDRSRILIACTWGAYTIQHNGGTVVGILISADKCRYDVNGKEVTVAYSILNAKEDAVNSTKIQIDKLFEELQFVSFTRDPRNHTQYYAPGAPGHNENYLEYYQLTMLDSMFTGGVKSFINDSTGSSGGSVTLDVNSMYDFIGVDNWTQD